MLSPILGALKHSDVFTVLNTDFCDLISFLGMSKNQLSVNFVFLRRYSDISAFKRGCFRDRIQKACYRFATFLSFICLSISL